jgi:hypothetical protein
MYGYTLTHTSGSSLATFLANRSVSVSFPQMLAARRMVSAKLSDRANGD